jgi:ABC-2 type transport system ATP-binding protein
MMFESVDHRSPEEPDSSYLINVENLNKTFGAVHAVRSLNLKVAAGEIYGLVGPDGAGKTTTIRLLCGALLPDKYQDDRQLPGDVILADSPSSKSGSAVASDPKREKKTSIEINGVDLMGQPDKAREQIGYLPQRFSLYEDLTVIENLRFFAEVRGLSQTEWEPRCLETLRFVGLDSFLDRRAGQLSGGMKQKLGLAAALVHNPRLLLLDEPTTGVDPVTRQDFWQLIIKLVNQMNLGHLEVAVLVSTPYMDEAARCSRLGFMRDGHLLLEGTPTELCSRLDGQIFELYGSPLRQLKQVVAAVNGVQDVRMFGDRLHLRIGSDQEGDLLSSIEQAVLDADGEIKSLRLIPAKLEDVFVSLLQNEKIL